MFGDIINFKESMIITVFSMIVVFVVLLVLVGLIELVATILSRGNKKSLSKEKVAEISKTIAKSTTLEMQNQDGIKKAAVITAATAAYREQMNISGDFVVRRFVKIDSDETPWKLASKRYN